MVNVYINWLKWFYFLSLEGGLLVILIECMIFLPSFVDVIRMSVSTVSFLAKLDSGILMLIKCFPLTYDLNGFKFKINRHLITVGSF